MIANLAAMMVDKYMDVISCDEAVISTLKLPKPSMRAAYQKNMQLEPEFF